ncbi:MAG TPA: hypothetical protein VH309_00840 [Elusimicrobiota bacterium]|jgi:hypothetical protein|nr:hypothetical protein [Elusimicrobiota bacterium]
MPTDEFELLLERCRERLSEISLRLPTLENGAPRPPQQVYSLTPHAPPPPKPAAAPKPPASHLPSLEPRAPERSAAPAPAPLPAAAPPVERSPAAAAKPAAPPPRPAVQREDDEVFPPLIARSKTPPPSSPLWGAPASPTPPPAPLPSNAGRRAGAAAAAAAIASAGAFGVWLARRPPPDLAIDVGDADAIAVRPPKADILVAQGKDLLDLSRDGRTLSRRSLEAPVDSLTWEPGSLWSSDGRTAEVVEHDDDGRSTLFTLNHVPGSLFVKDGYLWTGEKGGHAIHQFLISRSILGALLQPLDSYDLSPLSPEAFTVDENGTLWVADQETRRLFRLRLVNGSYKQVSSAPLSPFVGPDGRLRDLTIEGGAVWLLAQAGENGRVTLRRLQLSHLDWKPS